LFFDEPTSSSHPGWRCSLPITSGSAASTKSHSQTQRLPSTSVLSLIGLALTYFSAPLWPNFIPHVETLSHFVTHTLPKPVLIALLYRLAILYLASGILPTIGADDWEPEDPMESDRPVSLGLGFAR